MRRLWSALAPCRLSLAWTLMYLAAAGVIVATGGPGWLVAVHAGAAGWFARIALQEYSDQEPPGSADTPDDQPPRLLVSMTPAAGRYFEAASEAEQAALVAVAIADERGDVVLIERGES